MKLTKIYLNLFLGAILLGVAGCATRPVAKTNYSYDVYSFNLSESDFNYAKSFMNPSHFIYQNESVIVSLAHQNLFWQAVNEFNQRESFVDYRYKFYTCPIVSGKLVTANSCNYVSESNNTTIRFNFESYQDTQASYVFSFKQNGVVESLPVTFDSNGRYPLVFVKHPNGGQLFLIIKNHQHISWSSYQKTPQSVLQ